MHEAPENSDPAEYNAEQPRALGISKHTFSCAWTPDVTSAAHVARMSRDVALRDGSDRYQTCPAKHNLSIISATPRESRESPEPVTRFDSGASTKSDLARRTIYRKLLTFAPVPTERGSALAPMR